VPDFSFFPPSGTNLYCECQSSGPAWANHFSSSHKKITTSDTQQPGKKATRGNLKCVLYRKVMTGPDEIAKVRSRDVRELQCAVIWVGKHVGRTADLHSGAGEQFKTQ